jgi:di/tricarboxylate transporter
VDLPALDVNAFIAALVVFGVIGFLFFSRIAPDLIMVGGLTVLLLTGVIDVGDALSGFSNEGMITVGVLYVIVAGLRDTGVMGWVAQFVLGRPKTVAMAQIRMMLPVAGLSAFMNNTPLVAAMLPAVTEWGRKIGTPLSKLMMPLSFATILGGLCTLIGTSTNVVVGGLMQEAEREGTVDRGFTFFTLTPVGIACAAAGLAYILVASRWLLPARDSAVSQLADPREYSVEMLVQPGSALVGKTIEAAGLRHLRSMFLAEVTRDGDVMPAVAPTLRLKDNDRLLFVGIVDSVVELQKIRGLIPATEQVFRLDGPRNERMLIEAVVSDRCPLVGRTIREGRFRNRYNAAVIAVARSGERVKDKLGDIVLQAGDTLLIEARPAFIEQQRDSRDFYLVSRLDDSATPRHEKAFTALVILLGMVGCATLFEQHPYFIERGFGMLHAALVAAVLMLVTNCCSVNSARRTIDWQVLLVIGAAIGIGRALQETGLAMFLAQSLIAVVGDSPTMQLLAVYFATMALTEILTNNSAAVLMFPIALATAGESGLNPLPFVVAMTIAASCGFATPFGYQTNLMVYGPGGYRFVDFIRFGLPLNLIVAAITIALVPLVFPFN